MGFVQYQAEGGEQLKNFTSKTSKDSRIQNVEKDELLGSKSSKITSIQSKKNGRNVTGRGKIKSSRSPLKERKPENGNKVLFILYALFCLRRNIAV